MIRFQEINNSFNGYSQTFRSYVNYLDLEALYNDVRNPIYNLLNTSAALRLRIVICLQITFFKITENNRLTQNFYFCSHANRILASNQILTAVENCFRKIFVNVENFIRNGSGFIIENITYIDIHVGNYREMRGGCKFIKLPTALANKKHFYLSTALTTDVFYFVFWQNSSHKKRMRIDLSNITNI